MPSANRRIADLLVPLRDWQLRGENGRTYLIAILADLPEVTSFRFRQRRHRQVAKQGLGPSAKRRVTVAARFLRQSASDEALANSGWCHDKLMAKIAGRVSDKHLLKLIRAFLRAGVMEGGLRVR